jgi:hypothetical protein
VTKLLFFIQDTTASYQPLKITIVQVLAYTAQKDPNMSEGSSPVVMDFVGPFLYEEEKAKWWLCSITHYRPNVARLQESRQALDSLVSFHNEKEQKAEESRLLRKDIERWERHLYGPERTGLSDSD